MCKFFVKANRRCWHSSLLDLWCQRAGSSPLVVEINNELVKLLPFDRTPRGIKDTLISYRSSWGYLTVFTTTPRYSYEVFEATVNSIDSLLSGPMHRLSSLSVVETHNHGYTDTVNLMAEHVPLLREVALTHMSIRFAGAMNVTDVRCCSFAHETCSNWIKALHCLPNLELFSIPLDVMGALHTSPHLQTTVLLPNLHTLNINRVPWDPYSYTDPYYRTEPVGMEPTIEVASAFFKLIKAPRLQHLALDRICKQLCHELCRLMVMT